MRAEHISKSDNEIGCNTQKKWAGGRSNKKRKKKKKKETSEKKCLMENDYNSYIININDV